MKTVVVKLLLLVALLLPIPALAIEYLWTDHQGRRHFDCGGFVVGGKAIVKDLGRGQYRVQGVLVDRQVTATSIYHAAQIGCGEREVFEPGPPVADTPEETN
ncbi:hypothetical protein KJ966_29960 [bacterium]|nr:hypothetical protein [bacterium]